MYSESGTVTLVDRCLMLSYFKLECCVSSSVISGWFRSVYFVFKKFL